MQPMMEKNGMSAEEAWDFLRTRKEGVLATNGADGFPYGAPVNYAVIDGSIYLHGRAAGEKIDNIARDPRICFTVMESGGFEITGEMACNATTVYGSVIVRGKAVIITDDEEKGRILMALAEKLVPEKAGTHVDMSRVARTAVIRIDAESVTGKRHAPMGGHRVVGSQQRRYRSGHDYGHQDDGDGGPSPIPLVKKRHQGCEEADQRGAYHEPETQILHVLPIHDYPDDQRRQADADGNAHSQRGPIVEGAHSIPPACRSMIPAMKNSSTPKYFFRCLALSLRATKTPNMDPKNAPMAMPAA